METQDGVLVRQPEPLVLGLRDLAIVYSEVSSTPATSSLRARAAQGRICGVLGRVPTRGWTGPSHVRRCPLRPPRPTLHVCDGLWPMVGEPLRAPGPTSPHPGPFLLHPVPQGSPGKPTLWSHAPLPCPGPQIRPLDRVFLPWKPLEAGQRLRDTGSRPAFCWVSQKVCSSKTQMRFFYQPNTSAWLVSGHEDLGKLRLVQPGRGQLS